MIPLRIRAEIASSEMLPFVVRVREPGDGRAAVPEFDAIVVCHGDDGALDVETPRGPIRLHQTPGQPILGDVLMILPQRQAAQRLIRAASANNSILLTERCDQLCLMCSQPPKENHVDLFPLFLEACLLAPRNARIGLTGGEPTLFKDQLFWLLRNALAGRPDLTFHVLTNGQHFEPEDEPILRQLPRDRVLWGIPLYGPTAELHDVVVAKPGAFDRLQQTFALLARTGASIELRTVAMRNTVPELPALADYLATFLPFITVWAVMQLESIGYGRKNWAELFHDSGRDFGPIGDAIDLALARGLDVRLYNFPLCAVSEPYRDLAPATISDWKRKYLGACDGCRLRSSCGGFFEWYPEKSGFSHVGLS